MPRSPVLALVLDALAVDPDRTEPYTTSEVREWVAYYGHHPVTRDTIARHLNVLADEWEVARVSRRGKTFAGEHLWSLSAEGWDARRRAVETARAFKEAFGGPVIAPRDA